MSAEDWKLQVSYKTPLGDLINIRANTSDELSVLLEGIGDYSVQIASVQKLIVGAYNTLPLTMPPSTPSTVQSTFSAPTPTAQAFGTAAPTCVHGTRVRREGISKTTSKPYAFWACPTPMGTPDQCKPVN